MARSLKTAGLEELERLRSRVRRQLALKRITPDNCEWIVQKLDEIEARIVAMDERGSDREL